MPGTLVVSLLFLLEHLNLHWPLGVGQRVARDGGKGPAGVAGKRVWGKLELMLEDTLPLTHRWGRCVGRHTDLITATGRPGTHPLPRSLRANQPLRSSWYPDLSAATVALGTGGAGHYAASTFISGLIFAKPPPRPPMPLQAATMLSFGDTCYKFSTKYFSRSQWTWKALGLVFTIFLRIFMNNKFI